MTRPKFSVAMCIYIKDNADFFRLALDSTCDQTVKPDQIVIVADGPVHSEMTDIIDSAVKQYPEIEFTPVYLEKNVGFGNACQVAVENCKYELVARMDSDDICIHDRFEKQLDFFCEHPDVDVFGGSTSGFIDNPNELTYTFTLPLVNDEIRVAMRSKCPLAHVTVMFKKSSVIAAGGYIEWFCEEDYYLWARMIKNGCKTANLPDVLVLVRTTPEQMGRRGGKKYFKSEYRMQKFLFDSKLINVYEFVRNVTLRFIAEILLTNGMRYKIRKIFIWKK